jgi:hypothetical protein
MECAGSSELSWLHCCLGAWPRMMQVMHSSELSNLLLGRCREFAWA